MVFIHLLPDFVYLFIYFSVNNKSMENESLKVVKVKEGMSDFSESFLELAYKTSMIFTAHAKVVGCLPDARSIPIEDLKYSGV